MISKQVFVAGIDLLQRHYKTKLEIDVIGIWKRYLDQQLDDDQFAAAVDKAILSTPFMPVPEKLVEFASGSLQTKAMEEWRTNVLKWAASSAENQQKILPSFSPRCRAALQLVGGFHAVGLAEDWELRQLEQQFITAYAQCAPNGRQLPPAKIKPVTVEPMEQEPYKPTGLNKPAPLKRISEIIQSRIAGKQLSAQQEALNMFVLKWEWQIDEGRLEHYLAMSHEEKIQFYARFGYAMRNSPSWKSAPTHFDVITKYAAPSPKVDSRAIAREWLQN